MLFFKKPSKYANLTINTMRMLGADAIATAKSGHTGITLGAAPIMYALFHDHINVNPQDPFYFNRDRFVLSAGHGSALLYATMIVSGYKFITIEDLKNFRQLNSKCPGHPENHVLPGIEVGTGPLGQGIAMGVGMAIAEAKLASIFNKYESLINHYTYVLFGDGCLQEGVALEAIAIAGKLKLGKLIMLYDSNHIQLDGKVSDSTKWNVKKLFKANRWNYIRVKNGNNYLNISRAISKAKRLNLGKPTVIECNTTIGFGSRFQNSNSIHGVPLNQEQLDELRNNLNYRIKPFEIHPNVFQEMEVIKKRGANAQKDFNMSLQHLESRDINLYNKFIDLSNNKFDFDVNWYNNFPKKEEAATRNIVSDVLQTMLEHNSTMMIGAADLTSSTLVTYKKSIPFSNKTKDGQNINYGVREFAMTCINNGINIHGGCRAITSTFLSFSDYCKNAIRLAAISYIPSINIYSHDTITVGEDGPTHQPIEQIWSLRLIPNHYVFRPANLTESVIALSYAMKSSLIPTTIITSRGSFKQYDSSIEDVKMGAYVIYPCDNHDLNIVATGSEVALAIEVAQTLKQKRVKARVISLPCLKLFESQGSNYHAQIFDGKPTVSIEYGVTTPWYKYVDLAIGIDQFGKSGKPKDVIDYFDLSATKISDKINTWYKDIIKEGK